MAADMGLSPEILDTDASPPDKYVGKVGHKTGLMECLRGRGGQHKPWNDSIKAMKMVLSDKRHQSEALEKPVLQSCLDKLHRAMKIVSQQSLIERLDLISRQLGMMFTPPTSPENHVILSAEMFKVVILLEGQNGIKDVRVGHQEKPTSCEDLVEVLSKGDFDAFISHLRGLLGIYSINGDKKQKTKGYLALSSLESDLNLLAQLQSSINGVANYIHKSPLGILLPRRGGHPMKLIYFVSPYDLLCKRTKSSYPMTVEAITENELGHSVTVCMEPSTVASKLQTMPLMSVRTADGKSLPSFQGVNNINSYSLCATFVLVLPQPVPTTLSVICAIREITGQDVICGPQKPLMSLLLEQSASDRRVNTNQLFVTLPDQNHVYYLSSSHESSYMGQAGSLVTRIPFTHPTSVPNVLNLLRQQLLFNTVVQSLVRPAANQDLKSSLAFEVTTLSLQYLSVMFEHPLHSSMVTVEFDLSDITSAKCRVCCNNQDEAICSDDFVSRAFQRCFSIPVTLRTVIQKVRGQVQQLMPPEPTQIVYVKRQLKWVSKPFVKNYTCATSVTTPVSHMAATNFANPPPPYPSGLDPQVVQQTQLDMRKYQLTQGLPNRPPADIQNSEEMGDKQPANPLLATLLDAGSPVSSQSVPESPQSIVNESPMLSKLLEENTSVATNPFPPPNPRKRLTKRKSSKDIISGKSPKQRISDSDVLERTSSVSEHGRYGQGIAEKHIDLDSSGGSYDEPVRPSSVNSVSSLGAQSTGSVIDLTDIGESHVKKLENSLDSIMQKESRAGSVTMSYGMNVNSHMAGGHQDLMDMHLGMNDFHNQNPNPMFPDGGVDYHQFPPPWSSRQTPPTPTSRNSPHHGVVPKNEKISTSLEDLLSGPGGREIEGPNSLHSRRNSQQLHRRHSLKRQNSSGRNSVDSMTGGGTPDVFSPLMSSPSHHPLASPSNHMTGPFPTSSPSSLVSPGSLVSPTNSCGSSPSHPFPLLSHMKNELIDSKYGILGHQLAAGGLGARPVHMVSSGGKPSLSALKAQLDMNNDTSAGSNSQEKDWILKEDASSHPPLVKLKLSNMRQYDSVSPADSEGNKSRTSTFDFHSDDDEEFSLPKVDKITVISSTPTRLQISNKTTLASFNKFNKSEKFKRKEREKELKKTLSFDSDKKRKRGKEESKKEKKRKKLTNANYSIENDVVYKSTTVHVDDGDENGTYKPMPKLKITKSGVKMSIENNVLQAKEVKSEIKTDRTSSKYMKLDKEVVVKVEKVEKVEKANRRIMEKETDKDAIKDVKDMSVLNVSVKTERENKDVKEIKESVKSEDKSPSSVLTRTPSSHNSDEGIFDKINAMKTENLPRVDSEPVNSSTKSNSVSQTSNAITTTTASVTATVTSSTTSTTSSTTTTSSVGTSSTSSTSATSSQSSPVSVLANKKPSSSSSSKSQKSQKSRSNSTKSVAKLLKQPTIKLKPIVIPSTCSSSVSSKPSPSMPSIPKSITQSPTSATIGKIGAVSLATSGSQKQLVQTSNSKSVQGQSSGKTSSNSSKTSSSGSVSSMLSSSKSAGNLQKSVQIQGPSGKNSPIPQTSKTGHSRSSSSGGGSSSLSKSEKSSSKGLSSSSSVRTSSPLSEREKSKSSSSRRESSSGRDRDRDKSTSSSKNNVPVTTVITQETAASVLSFLNPKANKISSLPPIPKLSSAGGGQKVSTPTSTTTNSIVSTSVTTASSTTSSSSKFNAKTNSTMSNSFNKGPNATSSKSNSSFNKMNNSYTSNSRPQNPAVSSASNMNRTGTNSPVNYTQKGSSSSYNKSTNSNSSNNSSQSFRNSNSNTNSTQSKNLSVTSSSSSPSMNRPISSASVSNTYSSSSKGHNTNNSSQGHRGSNSTSPGNRGTNSNPSVNTVPSSSGSSRPSVSVNNSNSVVSKVRGSNSGPNAPKGPGPPAAASHQSNHSSVNDERGKSTSGHPNAAARGRKGSLSAVIDKLTCKATIPTPGSSPGQSAGSSHGGVVIDESPASPEPDGPTSSEKLDEKKVVIFEAPASPEPENTSPERHGAKNMGPSKGSIVSIPLDTQVSQDSTNARQYSVDSKKSGKVSDTTDKPHRPNTLSMPSSNSPKIIPLNSPKEKVHTPTSKTTNRTFVKQNSNENYQQHNGDIGNEGSGISTHAVGSGRRGSKDRSISPITKEQNNSPALDLCNTSSNKSRVAECDKTKEKMFKVPTPVSMEECERDNMDTCRKRLSSSAEKAISCSPPSSPENGLIIDFPSSPRHSKSSPQCFNDSPNFAKTLNSKETALKSKMSPASSPLDKGSSEIPANSPCMLDDDLMDEALGIGN